MKRTLSVASLASMLGGMMSLAACSSDSSTPAPLTDDQQQKAVATGMQVALQSDINALVQASKDVQTAAPVGHGWDATQDATAIQTMKAAWVRARVAYEHIEGALAPVFPDVDKTIDFRYDDFLDALKPGGEDNLDGSKPAGDDNLFDDQGVTGLHAVERILYVNETPAAVVTFESTLDGYKAAAYPASAQEASDFKTKLVGKMITDAQFFHDSWTVAKINVGDAFNGLIGLMNEQAEKVNKASGGTEESRYSQRTMADLRDNLSGTKAIYQVFQPWLASKSNASDANLDGKKVDAAIEAGFTALAARYAQVTGDSFPPAPDTWNPDSPSAADLATPFGQLYSAVRAAVDPAVDGSIGNRMNAAARILGLPEFTE